MIKPMYVGYAEFSHPSWLGLVCRHATAHHHMAAPAHSGVYRWQMRANRAEGTVSQRQVAYPFFCVVQLRTAFVMTPYLLRGLAVERPNQVWAMDITYIPMARGFVYLAAVVDWFSRRVLAWRVSITMEVEFCLEAVDEALAKHDRPEIFNTDQGSQFTSVDFTGLLLDNAIAISMDGRGAWRDNVFVERLWRSVKHEEVYLRAYDSVGEARASIGRYLDFYNCKRPHSSLDARTPDRAYFEHLRQVAAA